jgi:hypothetical protein
LERLEGRELMAFTPLGFSLPDLSVAGFAAPTAAWGQTLAVTVDVKNTGTSTINEPLALVPGSTSTADAQPTVVEVFATTHPTIAAARHQAFVGFITVPTVVQNSVEQITSELTLPAQPPVFAFPGDGGKIYLHFVVNPFGNIVESDTTNNNSFSGPIRIEAPLPAIQAIGLDVPPVMQPGDLIAPYIQIANYGTTDITPANPLQVDLVASLSPTFGPGSSILAQFTVDNLPAQAKAPNKDQSFAPTILGTPANVVTIGGFTILLPNTPGFYFLGVVTDPNGQIPQLQKIGTVHIRKNPFGLPHPVTTIKFFPPAGALNANGQANNLPFPNFIPTT